jgi:hypothetical protein
MAYEYRAVGVNVTPIPAPDPVKAREQLKVSQEFIEKEFANHDQNSQATNTPLQVQNLLNIYGKRGWQHYYEGKIGDQVLLYFCRAINTEIPDVAFTAEEQATTQMLAVEQRP